MSPAVFNVLQLVLSVFGLTAVAMATSRSAWARRWSCAVGLAGQPAWFVFAYVTQAWGLGLLATAFTIVYARGLWVALRKP